MAWHGIVFVPIFGSCMLSPLMVLPLMQLMEKLELQQVISWRVATQTLYFNQQPSLFGSHIRPHTMTVTIASALVFVEIKNAVFLKTLSDAMISLWLKWELRAMVVLSLIVQVILIKFGSRRSFVGKKAKLISFLVWIMYLFADWLATVALSTLLRSKEEQITSPLSIFWTPFLLLHLGGPHNITAYSLSDNELWPRHVFVLCFQIGVALYVYVKFWTLTVTELNFMAIPIFMVGIIKYGERVSALFKASSVRFRKSVFSSPAAKSFELETDLPQQNKENSTAKVELEKYLENQRIEEKYRYLHRAYMLFQVFRPMFLDLKLRIFNDLAYIFNMANSKVSAEEAFKTVEVELGFLYDLLYTKIPIVLTSIGVFLRCICLSVTTSTLIAFMFVVGKHGYKKVDIGISYLLMVVAISFELFSAYVLLTSDRVIQWLTNPNNSSVLKATGRFICSKLYYLNTGRRKMGIRTIEQHNLLDYCLQPRKINFYAVLKVFDQEKYFRTCWKDVNSDFKEQIYTHLHAKRQKYQEGEFDYGKLTEILDERGRYVLNKRGSAIAAEIEWSITEVEFTHSILLWHIATDVVYLDDMHRVLDGSLSHYSHISKLISDYMMYLLFLCPTMLPESIGNIRHDNTCKEVINFFHKNAKPASATRNPSGDYWGSTSHLDPSLSRWEEEGSRYYSKAARLRQSCKLWYLSSNGSTMRNGK